MKNRELHELLGLKWVEPIYNSEGEILNTIGLSMNPDYAADPRLVLREMKKLKLWLGFLGHLDDIGYYDTLTWIPELLLDTTGKLRNLAIEYLRKE